MLVCGGYRSHGSWDCSLFLLPFAILVARFSLAWLPVVCEKQAWGPHNYYWTVISIIRCNSLLSLKKFCGVTLNPLNRMFFNFPKSWMLSWLSKFDNKKMGVTKLIFELQEPKAKIKGILRRSYGCYGSLLCQKIDRSTLSNDWEVFWYHEFAINWHYSVVIMTNQDLRLGTVLRHLKLVLELIHTQIKETR